MSRFQIVLILGVTPTLLSAPECIVKGEVVRTVALTGHPAPGRPGGTVFADFEGLGINGPGINNHGQTAFRATVHSGVGSSTDPEGGILSEGSGALDLLFHGQNPLYPILNDAGNTAFYASDGAWFTQRGSLVAVATTGTQAADVPVGTNYFSVGNPKINNREQVVFRAFLQPNSDGGIWAGTPTALTLIARQGDQPAGIELGGRYQHFLYNPSLNDEGQVAFLASLSGTNHVPSDHIGIWTGHFGAIRLVARGGSQAPHTPVGSVFDRLNPPTMGDQGQVSYVGFLREGSGGVVADNSQGIWIDRNGVPILIARAGDFAPGAPGGAVFRSFNDPVLGGNDHIAFRGFLREGIGGVNAENRMGIWSSDGEKMKLIARAQGPAAGTQGVFDFLDFDSLSINDRGQVAFLGGLRAGEGGVTDNDNLGIWAEDATGVLQLVVRTGSEMEVAPNDFRVLDGLVLLGATAKIGSGFNDLGQIAFIANFADGSSGIFVSNRVAVPEPDSTVLALVVMLAVYTNKSRRDMR